MKRLVVLTLISSLKHFVLSILVLVNETVSCVDTNVSLKQFVLSILVSINETVSCVDTDVSLKQFDLSILVSSMKRCQHWCWSMKRLVVLTLILSLEPFCQYCIVNETASCVNTDIIIETVCSVNTGFVSEMVSCVNTDIIIETVRSVSTGIGQ